jgi:hypothetical protein
MLWSIAVLPLMLGMNLLAKNEATLALKPRSLGGDWHTGRFQCR